MALLGKHGTNKKLSFYLAALLILLAAFSAYFQFYPPARVIGSVKSLVNISEISTPLPEGAIPEINNPKFITAGSATYPEDKDLVAGMAYNGVTKAYPVKMLNLHEVVNDNFSGKPVSMTYCVLCRTPIAYEGRISGKKATFRVTGLLYNANDLLVDIETRSYWQQITGEAVVGDAIGKNLTKIPTEMTTWALWKAKYPDTLVMSSDTGFDRDYGTDPYGGYEESDKTWYFPKKEDGRLFVKDIIYGVAFNEGSKAYPKSNVTSDGVINDQIGKNKLLIMHDSDLDTVKVFDRVLRGTELNFETVDGKIVDMKTKSSWNYEGVAVDGPLKTEKLKRIDATHSFWYVWAGFYPQTSVYKEMETKNTVV
ncbi:MAG: DUF3179 domain-containing protein [Candidatus Aenigmarchaeota archaeon]|nr:DUF3179 domain-containing protein [Candidatus Aenigmarchaeota archaeon]